MVINKGGFMKHLISVKAFPDDAKKFKELQKENRDKGILASVLFSEMLKAYSEKKEVKND